MPCFIPLSIACIYNITTLIRKVNTKTIEEPKSVSFCLNENNKDNNLSCLKSRPMIINGDKNIITKYIIAELSVHRVWIILHNY